jgi:hypothetical protein
MIVINIDFSRIRNHDGSQDGGYEELVCQLAHLSPPEGADYFVRKEGAGGDAGVECYWKLNDGTEHGWQAKYFTDVIASNQWSQISESVKTALEKHPKLTKYYVCLPRDWTDSRKNIRSGEKVNSAWDKWQENVKKWQVLATNKRMKVEFIYWCKHEMSQMLQTDKPHFAGRALYWFGEPVLTLDDFKRVAEKSRTSLGERYTPELHLELPIARVFEGIGRTDVCWSMIQEEVAEWQQAYANLHDVFFKEIFANTSGKPFRELQRCVVELKKILQTGLRQRSFIAQLAKYKQLTQNVHSKANKCYGKLDRPPAARVTEFS